MSGGRRTDGRTRAQSGREEGFLSGSGLEFHHALGTANYNNQECNHHCTVASMTITTTTSGATETAKSNFDSAEESGKRTISVT